MGYIQERQSILVLMSTYNGEKYLEQQIESIMNQKVDSDLFLRIRDDGSKDNTCEIIYRMIEKYPDRIELMKGDNEGYNASFFELINSAQDFDYYSLSDQDDIWMEDKLQNALDCLRKEPPDVPLLYGSTSFLVHDDLIPYGTTRKRERKLTIYNTIVQNICPGHTQVFNNKMLEIVKIPLDVSKVYVYDSWITNLAMLYGTVIFDNTSHALYRQHKDNQLGSGKNPIGQLLSSLKKILKGDGKKYRNQVQYFVEKNRERLVQEEFFEKIYQFGNMNSFLDRVICCFCGKLYRQSALETIAFRLAILFGKY